MFFNTELFWIAVGVILVLVAFAFKAFAEDRGVKLNWWKWTLVVLWYSFVGLNLYTFGTFAGENEASGGFKLMLFGLFVALILGVGLWRLVMRPEAKAS